LVSRFIAAVGDEDKPPWWAFAYHSCWVARAASLRSRLSRGLEPCIATRF
jgi:hypothetical protein